MYVGFYTISLHVALYNLYHHNQNNSTVLSLHISFVWPLHSYTHFLLSIPNPCAATNLFSIFVIMLFQKCYITEIMQYVSFGTWLFSLRIISFSFIQVVAWITDLFSYCWVFRLLDIPCFIHHSSIEGDLSGFQFGAIAIWK